MSGVKKAENNLQLEWRPQEIQQCAFPEWFVIHQGDRVHPKSPLPPLSLSSPSSEPKFIPSFVAFGPQCLPLSFPSWLLSRAAIRPCSVLPFPFIQSGTEGRNPPRSPDVFGLGYVLALGDIHVRETELDCDWHCLNHMPWLSSVWLTAKHSVYAETDALASFNLFQGCQASDALFSSCSKELIHFQYPSTLLKVLERQCKLKSI